MINTSSNNWYVGVVFKGKVASIQNIFIKYILQEEKKNKNETTNLENVEEIENLKKYLENLKNIEKKNNSDLLNITSYAQFLEDIVLFLFLYDVKKGFYIDVGANDPIKDSVIIVKK